MMNTIKPRTFLKNLNKWFLLGVFAYFSLNLSEEPPPKKRKPSILLITLDTTRADKLGCYGYDKRTTANLDKFAKKSTIYTRTYASSSWTLPAHASLFTGKYTSSHGARYDPQGSLILSNAVKGHAVYNQYRASGISSEERTLAEILRKADYETGAVVGGPWLKKIFGLDKGFNYYDDSQITAINGRKAQNVTKHAIQWLQKFKENQFFLFLNYFDPHAPCLPPREAALIFLPQNTSSHHKKKTLKRITALYCGEILFMDYNLGIVLDYLKKSGLYDNTLIIITADHGELLGEHGVSGHGKFLFQEELHIPLLIQYPGRRSFQQPTETVIQQPDIMPLILDYLEISKPEDIQGSSPENIKHPAYAEVYPLKIDSQYGDWRAIYDGDFKYLFNSKGKNHLFSLQDDPGEKINLLKKYPEQVKKMQVMMYEFMSSFSKPKISHSIQDIDQETKDALHSLGYLK